MLQLQLNTHSISTSRTQYAERRAERGFITLFFFCLLRLLFFLINMCQLPSLYIYVEGNVEHKLSICIFLLYKKVFLKFRFKQVLLRLFSPCYQEAPIRCCYYTCCFTAHCLFKNNIQTVTLYISRLLFYKISVCQLSSLCIYVEQIVQRTPSICFSVSSCIKSNILKCSF